MNWKFIQQKIDIMKKIYLWLLLPLSIFGGCESLEDTYKDYAGDGPIRYLVKCDDLDVKAGWNRLVVSWKSVDDPIIDKSFLDGRWDRTGYFVGKRYVCVQPAL